MARIGRIDDSGQRIENRPATAEIAVQLLNAGNTGILCGALPRACAFVIREKEDFVVLDGTAYGGAELVALQRWHGLSEEISRLDFFVANVLIRAAVKIVGTALQRRVDDGWLGVLGAHAAGQHLELVDRIGGRGNGCGPQLVFRNVETIEQPSRGQP